MDVEIDISGFLLQNAFMRVKICFIGHKFVRPNICRSFDILSHFNNIATALKLRGSFFFFFVQYIYVGSVYPDSWSKSFIVSTCKQGDTSNPCNYRGIIIVNTIATMFSLALCYQLNSLS